MSGPLVVLTPDQLTSLVRDAVAAALAAAPPATAGTDPRAVHPDRIYTAEEANDLLGFGRTKSERMTIYDIPEEELPRCRVGPKRGASRFLGADLVAYARGLALPDIQALADGARGRLAERLERPSPVAGAVGASAGSRRRIV